MTLAMLIVLCASLVAAIPPPSDSPGLLTTSPLCEDKQSPPYQVLEEKAKYEVRRYPNSTWVCTNFKFANCEDSYNVNMIWPLSAYMQGENEQALTLTMTCPFIRMVKPEEGTVCDSTLCFYIDTTEGAAPVPTNNAVYINEMDTVEYYVMLFGGLGDTNDYMRRAKSLAATLKNDGLEGNYLADRFFAARYAATIAGRVNEVMLLKTA